MKKINSKKTFLFFGTLSTLSAPIASVVACGSSSVSRYDAENDGKLKIAHTFASTGSQFRALKTIIDKYNAWIDNLSKEERAKGYMKIEEPVQVSGGYGKAMDLLKKKFNARDKKTLFNLIIGYPGDAADLKQYSMELNLQDFLTDQQFKSLKGRFDPKYWLQNDRIGGLKAGGAYAIPISVSTMVNAVNTPLFAYIIDQVQLKNPNAVDLNQNPRIKALYDQGKKSADDITSIANQWGRMGSVTFKDNEVTDKILDEFDTLINFVSKCQRAFPNLGVKNPKKMHLLSMDSPTNLVQLLSYAYSNGDISKYYIQKNDDGYVAHEYLNNKNSDAYKNFKKGVDLLRDGVASGAIWIGGLGAYGSSLLMDHKAMFNLGSSAGVTYWHAKGSQSYRVGDITEAKVDAIYDKSSSGDLGKIYLAGEDAIARKAFFNASGFDQKFYAASYTRQLKYSNVKFIANYNEDNLTTDVQNFPILVKVATTSDTSFQALGTTSTDYKQIGVMPGAKNAKVYLLTGSFYNAQKSTSKFETVAVNSTASSTYNKIKTLLVVKGATYKLTKSYYGSYKNNIYENGAKATKESNYDLVLKEGLTIKSLLAKFKAGSGQEKFGYVVSISKDEVDKLKKALGTSAEEIGKRRDGEKIVFIVKNKEINILSQSQTLQEGEVKGITAPTKVSSETKGGVYVQGPSLIPVHSNGPEDKALALFVMWFTGNYKTTWNDGEDNKYVSKNPLTPLEYWEERASYIVPTVGAFADNSKTKQAIDAGLAGKGAKYWKGVAIAWATFNKVEKDANLSPIINPVDGYSGIARNDVTDVVIKAIYTSAHTKGTVKSFDKIYEELKRLAKSNDVG